MISLRNSKDKKARKLTKKRLGTLKRAKRKVEELTGIIAEQRRFVAPVSSSLYLIARIQSRPLDASLDSFGAELDHFAGIRLGLHCNLIRFPLLAFQPSHRRALPILRRWLSSRAFLISLRASPRVYFGLREKGRKHERSASRCPAVTSLV
jgi:hypothetical protein